ncbi:flagellar basal body P-ring formation chaperone FlgA [Rhizobium sp. YIM 134829]|uniref:flagellar basal body P-ring formation chaperone FlgA n=1 Tax=Rhizobium sp. YIM 134829 TaxID=3390453 RepID=UPI00397AFE87
MFGPKARGLLENGLAAFHRRLAQAAVILFGGLVTLPGTAFAGGPTAVIPTETIYPGQTVELGSLQVVEVTNPDLVGDYAVSTDQVVGKVTDRTLLAGRVILVQGLRDPYLVERGKAVRIVYNNGPLTITAGGAPLENAGIGALIRVRNTDSGVVVSGTVMADGSVQVVAK